MGPEVIGSRRRRQVTRRAPSELKTSFEKAAYRSKTKEELKEAATRNKGMYELGTLGMPPPGPNFVRYAANLTGQDTEYVKIKTKTATGKNKTITQAVLNPKVYDLYLEALRQPGFTLPIQLRGGRVEHVTFIPGHIWGQNQEQFVEAQWNSSIQVAPVDGPHPADVMVVGKMPWTEEEQHLRNLMGTTGQILLEYLQRLQASEEISSWYVTNVVKFVPPDGTTTLKADWIKDCAVLLEQELRLVQPKYILCLGSDASKAILGSGYNVTYMEGQVIPKEFSILSPEGEVVKHTAQVMTVVHPAMIARDETQGRTLERGLVKFLRLTRGISVENVEKDIDHRWIRNLEELEQLCCEVDNDPAAAKRLMAVDAEWHGEHPVNKKAYLRTVQFAWKPKAAAAVILTAPGGTHVFENADGEVDNASAYRLLTAFFRGKKYRLSDDRVVKFKPKRVIGHFFNADLEWLVAHDLDLRKEFSVPLRDLIISNELRSQETSRIVLARMYQKAGFSKRVPAWVRTRYEGGADTGLMAHAIEETANFKLETLAMRYTSVPRYDIALHEWRDAYCKEHKHKVKDLEGYGMCPEDVLVPYAIYDADATLRLFLALEKLLDNDYQHNCCREAFWESMIAAPAVLEIHQNGICVDRDRVDFLTTKFMEAKASQEEKIRGWAKWPAFNVRSVQHVKEFLYGENYNGKVTPDGEVIRLRPQEAESLHITPILDTSKPPKRWEEIVAKGREQEHSPSTNKLTLSLLAQDNLQVFEQVNMLRDHRFLDQVLKSILRPPAKDDEGDWVYDEGSPNNLVYDAGLASVICDDGRVRTHIYQTKETGRWASARPNLQNISKQRDPDYLRLLGKDNYKHKLRSILKSSPGHLFLEADYIGAELYGAAIMTGDKLLIEHATRNQLPEHDPLYYDIHSNVAVLAFKLQCRPNKTGLKEIGKTHLRIVAKSVIFGLFYGRGAAAIALAAREQGVVISVEEAQSVIDTIFRLYPGLVPFFEECKSRAVEERFLCNCFGRLRRFPPAMDQGMAGEFGRQAMNFPIQGMIASAVSRALAYLYDYKENCGNPNLFRILLQIHDAILLEVPDENVEFVAEQVLPWAMRQMVPIYPTTLAGQPTGAGPYYLGAEAEVMQFWGEGLSQEQAVKRGLHKSEWSGDGMSVKYFAKN